MRKIWDIHGGVHPPENKQQSIQLPIADIDLPELIVLPLNQHIGAPAQAIVQVGDKVQCGQLIAKAQGFVSAPVHASTSGKIVAIEDRAIPHPSGMSAPCIVIETDGLDTWSELDECEDLSLLTNEQLISKVRDCGIAGLGGAGFPAAVKLSTKTNIDTLILNGTECEPYITSDDMLMREYADDIIAGAELIARMIGKPETILIGVEDNKPTAISTLEQAAKNSSVDIVTFPTKYPSGGEKQLIQILTGKEVPSGKLPAELGIVMQNVGTAFAIWQAARYGKPLIERVTTVVGESLQTQRNIRARLGTPLKHILAQHGFDEQDCARIIIGGPMMGYTVEKLDVPVVKTTNCILVPSTAEMPEAPEAQACIRCGHCADACPANLLPQQLYWYSQSQDYEKLEAHHLFDCIECGACSFVCPSSIPLVQYYRAAKGDIRQQQAEKDKSDRARVRFEHRKERIEKIEAEKEAKRAARKKAAELARAKNAATKAAGKPEKSAAPSSTTPITRSTTGPIAAETPTPDPLHLAKSSNSEATDTGKPDEELIKLEKNLKSLENRVEVCKGQIEQALAEDDQEKVQRLQAKLSKSEQKLEQTHSDIKQFSKPSLKSAATQAASADDPVALAVARAQEKRTSVHEEKAKLERTLSSLENRLTVTKEQIVNAERDNDDTKVARLTAKLKQSQIKYEETQKKIAALSKHGEARPVDPQDAADTHSTDNAVDNTDQLQRTATSLRQRIAVMAEQIEQANKTDDREKVAKLEVKMATSQKKLTALESKLSQENNIH